ncbi:MAG: LacI family transcriptional regulator [Anaerolineae bacterium]|nr:LacI family transcriptional regulator [Anaerolineae bacterium]
MVRRPKLHDIASLAGVSIGTVSRVLNGKDNVAEETRDVVLSAALQLGYTLSSDAQQAGSRRITSLGVIKRTPFALRRHFDPFYGAVVTSIEQECQKHDISMSLTTAETDEYNEMRELPAMLTNPQVPALILIGIHLNADNVDMLINLNKPIILVDSYTPYSVFDAILTDNVDGGEQAANYLVRAGHRNIGYIGCHDNEYPSIRERHEGYLRALKRHGLPTHYSQPCMCHTEEARQATLDLLERAPEITAICGCNDRSTMAIMRTLNAAGRSVPHDISVIGFDNWEPAHDTVPPLTTMNVDTTRMGKLAVDCLLHRIDNPDEGVIKVALGTQLVERQSVRFLNS